MGTQRTTFEKLQRERAKKAKAAAKRERRQSRETEETVEPTVIPGDREYTAAELLDLIESLHKRFEAKQMSYDDFEEQKADLFGRLAALPMD